MDHREAQNRGILAEEMVVTRLLELGFNVARPVQIGPIDMLSIWDGETIKRLQVKSASIRTPDKLRYEFKVSPTSGNYVNSVDSLILVGVETHSFWVIPMAVAGEVKKINCTVGGNGQYDKYFAAWSLLKKA
jgi:hypothetical protein